MRFKLIVVLLLVLMLDLVCINNYQALENDDNKNIFRERLKNTEKLSILSQVYLTDLIFKVKTENSSLMFLSYCAANNISVNKKQADFFLKNKQGLVLNLKKMKKDFILVNQNNALYIDMHIISSNEIYNYLKSLNSNNHLNLGNFIYEMACIFNNPNFYSAYAVLLIEIDEKTNANQIVNLYLLADQFTKAALILNSYPVEFADISLSDKIYINEKAKNYAKALSLQLAFKKDDHEKLYKLYIY